MNDRVIEQRLFEEWFRTSPFFKQKDIEKPLLEAWMARSNVRIRLNFMSDREIKEASELKRHDPNACEDCGKNLFEDVFHVCN